VSNQQNLAIFQFIKCPDCGKENAIVECDANQTISCGQCSWSRPFSKDGKVLDLLATKPKDVDGLVKNTSISEFYYEQFQKDLSVQDLNESGWSIVNAHSSNRQSFFLRKLKAAVTQVVGLSISKKILIDLSAGAGDYTFENAKYFDFVIHCDINGDSLINAKNRAEQLGIHNIIFIRHDYLQFPFADKFCDIAIMIDSLEYYGHNSDKGTINNIYNMLKVNGIAIFDFHRKRPLKDNKLLYEYTRKDIDLVCESEIFNVSTLGRMVVGRISSMSYNKYIYWILNRIFFLPAVRSLMIMKRGERRKK